MKAVVVERFGGPEVLTLGERPDPVPGRGKLLLQVGAAGVGGADIMVRKGIYPFLAGGPPIVPGFEVAGRVVAVGDPLPGGPALTDLVGRRVLGLAPPGGHAELAVVEAAGSAELPDDVDDATAVAIGITGATAYVALNRVNPQAGDRVLIRGASGGMGSIATQLAARRGCLVTAATSGPAADILREWGASEIYLRTPERSVPPGPFDVVIDFVAGPETPLSVEALAPNGRLLVCGASGGLPGDEVWQHLMGSFGKSVTLHLLSLHSVGPEVIQDALAALVRATRAGELKPRVEACFPLSDALAAYALVESGQSIGKVVLQP
jgi:NADPH:quinone reductase-like Zn-dependent oxidoreductase